MNEVGDREAPSLAFELIGALQTVAGRLDSALEPLGLSLPKLKLLTKLADAHLLGLIEPEDIANMALYLASDESRMVTGQVLPVDSGVTIS